MEHPLVFDVSEPAHIGKDTLSHPTRGLTIGTTVENNELVATKASDNVVFSHAP
jgi:hypothetical protein